MAAVAMLLTRSLSLGQRTSQLATQDDRRPSRALLQAAVDAVLVAPGALCHRICKVLEAPPLHEVEVLMVLTTLGADGKLLAKLFWAFPAGAEMDLDAGRTGLEEPCCQASRDLRV